jgi:hypothetical protein
MMAEKESKMWSGQLFRLTGQTLVTPEHLVQSLNKALGASQEIRYEMVNRQVIDLLNVPFSLLANGAILAQHASLQQRNDSGSNGLV